jgi:hypothetical protein
MASSTVDERAVYSCTGNPLPQDIQGVLTWLLNENFVAAYESELPHMLCWQGPGRLQYWCLRACRAQAVHGGGSSGSRWGWKQQTPSIFACLPLPPIPHVSSIHAMLSQACSLCWNQQGSQLA